MRIRFMLFPLGIFFLSCWMACPAPEESGNPAETTDSLHEKVVVINTYPHDSQAFTQGLFYLSGLFYESTGLYGASSLRLVQPETGQVIKKVQLDTHYFGEGCAPAGNNIIQLTWKQGVAFVYNRETFEKTGQFTYSGEGWGITSDGTHLIMSDGTATLRFLDPVTFEETGHITVRDGNKPIEQLNELEYIKGFIYANIWQTDNIIRIDPQTGLVQAWIDCRGLLTPAETASADVLNGIAYDPEHDRIFITGKKWPKLFEVRFEPVSR